MTVTELQASLFGFDADTLVEAPTDHRLSVQERFDAFHERNPQVYRALVQMTRDLVSRGHRKVGVKMLIEVLRWQWAMTTFDPNSRFKLDNSLSSRYARLIAEREPDLAEVFETRELRA